MKAFGPLWAVILTVDRNLLGVFLVANALFSLALVFIAFRGRPIVDRVLIGLGLLLLLSVASTFALHTFARTPVREFQAFDLD